MNFLHINSWKLILAGGPLMIPLALCSIFVFAIIIERLIFLKQNTDDIDQLKKDVFEKIRQNNLSEAIGVCNSYSISLARIFKAGLVRFGTSPQEIKEVMEEASQVEIPVIEKNLNALGTIAQTTPLLGLLGTTVGLAEIFYVIQVKSSSLAPLGPSDLAAGIWKALITTIAALIITIPSYVAYNYLVQRVRILIVEMEKGASELLKYLSQTSEAPNLDSSEI